MIKFFRKIRQNLLAKGNIKQYFFYAIGEIVLVVFGILIALNINNRNEEYKNGKIEKEILEQLKEEYQFNLIQLEQKIAMRNQIIKASMDVLSYIDKPEQEVSKDMLYAKIRFLNIDPTFDPIENNIIGSGSIRFLKNKELKKRLSNWSSDIRAVQEMELQWQKTTTDLNTPFQIKLGILRDMEHENYQKEAAPIFIIGETKGNKLVLGKSRTSPSVKSIVENSELEGLIVLAIRTNNTANLQSVVLKERIVEILKLINQGLN
jgi:hypothetical protein